MFSIVGACPICGAPMYVPMVWHGIIPPPVTRSCGCFPDKKYEYATSAEATSLHTSDLDNSRTKPKKVLVPYDEHEKNIHDLIHMQEATNLEASGIACPKCSAELYIKKDVVLYTFPPKKEAVCTKCGHLCHISTL